MHNSKQNLSASEKSKINNETASSEDHTFYQHKLKKADIALRLASDAKATPSQLSPNSSSDNSASGALGKRWYHCA